MEDGKYVPGSIWFYAPDKVAPVVWAFLFLVSGLIHTWQCQHYKCWKVSGLFPWAALLFVIGYVLREYGAFHRDNLNVFIASIVFVYCAPPIYELSNYFILSRILYYVPYHSPIHPGRVLTTFGGLSAIIEALNGNGASYVSNQSLPQSKQNIGKALLKTALLLQLFVLLLFILLAATFHRKCLRANLLPKNLKAALITLYASSILIGLRTIYRTIEYFTTASLHITADIDPMSISPILRYEWYFWVFEGVFMMLNSFLLNARHPMRFLPRNNKIYLSQDGSEEIEGAGYEDKRYWLVTVFDPFDLVGACKGRNMERKFWETHEMGRGAEVESERTGDLEGGKSSVRGE